MLKLARVRRFNWQGRSSKSECISFNENTRDGAVISLPDNLFQSCFVAFKVEYC